MDLDVRNGKTESVKKKRPLEKGALMILCEPIFYG